MRDVDHESMRDDDNRCNRIKRDPVGSSRKTKLLTKIDAKFNNLNTFSVKFVFLLGSGSANVSREGGGSVCV